MKKTLLLISAMAACTLTAFAQTATTEPTFIAQELDGKTITLTCASGAGDACNGLYLLVNGSSIACAAEHGSHFYKWAVEYDATENGMILSAGGYYIGRVPDAAGTHFALTQDKDLAGRYRLYSYAEGQYCLTATKFVNGNTIETISTFGVGDNADANHWMQCTTIGPTRWGSGAPSSKWIYTEVAAEEAHHLLLPVTSARQIVDGGKYIIAAYNHNWGTENNADKRFLKFENNTNKFVSAAEATAESVIWTANAADYTCTSTIHGHSTIVTLSYGDQYIKQHTSGNVTSNATTTTCTDACNIFEFTTVAAPSGAAAGNTYFEIFYDKGTSRAWFYRNLWVGKKDNSSDMQMGFARLDTEAIGSDKRRQDTGTPGWSTYFLIWQVIETEDDLAKHAKGYMDERVASTETLGNGVGLFHLYSPEIDEIISKEGSETAVTQANLDAFTTAVEGIQVKLNMPRPGTYLTFKGSHNAGTLREQVRLFYNTEHGTRSGASKMNLDKNNTAAGYSEVKEIMYFDGDHLLSYSAGYYLGLDNSGWLAFRSDADMAESGDGNQPATIGIAPGTNNGATYQINFDNEGSSNSSQYSGLHINGSGSDYWYGDRCNATNLTTTLSENLHDWIVSQVDALPVTLAEDGYGSFFAPVAVTFGEDVTVYAATVGAENITFTEVEAGTMIAPGTPVVLKGTAAGSTTVNATIHYDYDPAVTPALQAESTGDITFFGKSAVEKLTATEDVYTFRPTSGADDVITMTKVDAGTCLPVNSMLVSLPSSCPLIKSGSTVELSLNQPNSTTGLREIGIDEDAADTCIYDLQGRRLAAPVRGINIINGRKVLVK